MDSCSASGTRLEPMGAVAYVIGFEDMRTNRNPRCTGEHPATGCWAHLSTRVLKGTAPE